MSFKKNSLLAGTCLSLAALSFFSIQNANAGFEWIPPEKKKPVEVIRPAPVEPEVTPVPAPEQVVEEVIEETAEIPASEEPEITIKVLDEETDADVVEESDPEQVIEVVETIEEEAPAAAEVKSEIVIEETAEEKIEIVEDTDSIIEIVEPTEDSGIAVEDVVVIEEVAEEEVVVVEPVAETEATSSPNSLTLDFNPETSDKSEAQPVAILPEDVAQTISDVPLPEEAPVVEEAVVETPEEEIYWAKKETFDVVEGFGNDIPLALALRQVVPARYAFNFEKGVNAGQKISWQGGKPWNEVLSAALEPIGVEFEIKRSTLIALKVGDTPVVTPPEPEPKSVQVEIAPSQEASLIADESDVIIEVPDVSVEDDSSSRVVEVVEEIEGVDEQVDAVAEVVDSEAEQALEDSKSPLDEIYGSVNTQESSVLDEDEDDIPVISDEIPEAEIIVPLEEQKKNEVIDTVVSDSEQPVIANDAPEESINWNKTPEDDGSAQDEAKVLEDVVEENAEDLQKTEDIIEESKIDSGVEPVVVTSAVIEDVVADLENISPSAAHGHSHNHDEAIVEDIDFVEVSAEDSPFRFQPSGEILVWEARKGARVKRVLEKWAKTENIDFSWVGPADSKIDKDVFISGTFSNAVDILMDTSVNNPPKYRFDNQDGFKLIVDAE